MASSVGSGSEDHHHKKIWIKNIGPPPEDPVCDSGIYCYGPLLEAVQMARIYPDSKTFVDKKLKFPPGKIIKNFQDLLAKNKGAHLTIQQVKKFVEDHFDAEGTELETWLPEDWTSEPDFISQLRKPALKGLARRINRLWKELSRKIKDDVKDNPSLYSVIYVPNGFIVPGGRFREFYYWDTYWIVKALLHCDMTHTVRGIIENFLTMVETFGLVPNGGRIYYVKRSQPPFLTLMVKEYWDKTNDVQFVRAHLATLEKELEFWEAHRTIEVNVDGKDEILFRYGTGGTGPRPESYREDVELAEKILDPAERETFYYNMKAGAESGWDYSTRWMINDQGGLIGDLRDIKTNYIIPVDLNAIMFMNYSCVSEFYSVLGDTAKADEFAQKARKLAEAIECILWNEDEEMWFDYDVLNNKQRIYFFPSNLVPLWAECYDLSQKEKMAKSALKYLRKTGAMRCKGGVPTSMHESGQQWDFPNAWPPLQHILVAGLMKTGYEEARKMALTIARRYTSGTMFSCLEGSEVCNMFEKYHVTSTGTAGGGGEYEVQTGFGWTNGVVIDFMVTFGDELLSDEEDEGGDFEVAMNTQFDVTLGHSAVRTRRASIVTRRMSEFVTPKDAFMNLPEKHELETSEKCDRVVENIMIHPALEIEEDDFVSESETLLNPEKLRTTRKKLSSIHGDILVDVEDSPKSLKAFERATSILDEILEQHEDFLGDKDEVSRRISRSSENVESEELVVHLSSADDKFDDVAKQNFNRKHDERISIRLKGNDVNVFLLDNVGKEVPVTDVDLELELPARFKSSSRLKSRLRRLIQRLKRINSKEKLEDKSVMYIKDRVRVKDHTGKEFDVEMDLKVEIQPTEQEEEFNSLTGSKFMCPLPVPWNRHRNRKSGVEDRHRSRSTNRNTDNENLSTSGSIHSMEQMKILEMENNNVTCTEADIKLWKTEKEEDIVDQRGSLADIFRYTPV